MATTRNGESKEKGLEQINVQQIIQDVKNLVIAAAASEQKIAINEYVIQVNRLVNNISESLQLLEAKHFTQEKFTSLAKETATLIKNLKEEKNKAIAACKDESQKKSIEAQSEKIIQLAATTWTKIKTNLPLIKAASQVGGVDAAKKVLTSSPATVFAPNTKVSSVAAPTLGGTR